LDGLNGEKQSGRLAQIRDRQTLDQPLSFILRELLFFGGQRMTVKVFDRHVIERLGRVEKHIVVRMLREGFFETFQFGNEIVYFTEELFDFSEFDGYVVPLFLLFSVFKVGCHNNHL
jgi:hypothetical protein